MKNIHPTQLQILQKLMYSNGLKFSQLKPGRTGNGIFTFHLDRLVQERWVAKKDAIYLLTEQGKELAGRMDLGDKMLKNQAKISVVMVCIDTTGTEDKYLLYTRFKSPFYKFQGFPTGKVQKGEDILDSAKRELKEETSLDGHATLSGVLHSRIFSPTKELLEDKIFFVCQFINPKGKLVNGPEGKYKWIAKSKIDAYLQNPVQEISDIFAMLAQKEVVFLEKSYTVDSL